MRNKKNTILPLFLYLVSFLVFTSFNNAADGGVHITNKVLNPTVVASNTTESSAVALYESMNLQEAGLSINTFEKAIKGYNKLVTAGLVNNSRYLTIVDLSQSSRKKRFYLLDMENNTLAINTFVSHGKNSGVDMARSFSNTPESEKSSLGFYITKQTYTGKHGLSLKLSGLEYGFNNNAERRAIVVHGAEYVNAGRVNSDYMGRSQGCPALPENKASEVINLIKGGSALFVYHPTESYLNGSKLINDDSENM